MTQLFKIAATDRVTGVTLYGRLNRGVVTFRTGAAFSNTPERALGLHTHPAGATLLEIEKAGELLVETIARLGMAGWVSDLRIIAA